MRDTQRLLQVGVVIIVGYFLAFPGELQSLAPALELTNSVSLGFYGVIMVAIVANAIVKVWGGKKTVS